MQNKRVFIAALNWGSGHICRIIPIIRELQMQNCEVLVGTSPWQEKILRQELTHIKCLPFPHLNINLSGGKFQTLKLILKFPRFFIQLIREHRALEKLILNEKIDLVISDSCYGLWHKNIHTIFITHQLNLQLPRSIRYLQKPINIFNHWIIQKYSECWVPDYKPGFYAGDMSINRGIKNVLYIGILSRFSDKAPSTLSIKKNTLLYILSGPEPQRSIFEKKIIKVSRNLSKPWTYQIIGRKQLQPSVINDTQLQNFITGNELVEVILQAETIICRGGYSTIMDLLALQRTALLIPTPQQSEQEYLGKWLSQKGIFKMVNQKELNYSVINKYLLKGEIANVTLEGNELKNKLNIVVSNVLNKP